MAGIQRDFRLVWVYELLKQMLELGWVVGLMRWFVLVDALHLVEQNQQYLSLDHLEEFVSTLS